MKPNLGPGYVALIIILTNNNFIELGSGSHIAISANPRVIRGAFKENQER